MVTKTDSEYYCCCILLRNHVMQALCAVDPVGCQRRKATQFKGQVYFSKVYVCFAYLVLMHIIVLIIFDGTGTQLYLAR